MIFLSSNKILYICKELIKGKRTMNQDLRNKAVGDIVARDFRTAGIFSGAGIDFCCGGKQNLQEACLEKGMDISKLETELNSVMETPMSHAQNFNEWELDFLCDYIVNTHHKFVLKKLPELAFYTQKIAGVHGGHHPELLEVSKLFEKINIELVQHLQHEEEIVFPAIKSLVRNNEADKNVMKAEIDRLTGEHDFAGGSMDKINSLTGGYTVPSDACNTYQVSLKLLKEFEDDLHIHVHLENNILFPKALQLTGKL
jgi:regulator of cell morphogenesis and NO signaling